MTLLAVNAFGPRLEGLDLDIFDTLVVDFFHEIELGDFKYLVRFLNTQGADVVHEFNESTIGRVNDSNNSAQCIGIEETRRKESCLLHTPHNETILSLWYRCTDWDFLGKLRLHTDSSLKVLDTVTVFFGGKLRYFANVTCPQFKELRWIRSTLLDRGLLPAVRQPEGILRPISRLPLYPMCSRQRRANARGPPVSNHALGH
ncbi:hypothetical protein B0H19DRAFT_1386202 [Mycena capillaripes]|nr:hypothetical protein B0H19DRAFT_1386202 [Mycena capillaripes]